SRDRRPRRPSRSPRRAIDDRRQEAAGTCARTERAPQTFAARRGARRSQSDRDRANDHRDPPHPRSRHRHPADRARDACAHEVVGWHRGTRARPQAGGGDAALGGEQSGRHCCLSRRARANRPKRGGVFMSEPLLRVEALEAGYDEVQVLWGISLGVAAGGMTTLVGANGAGKTTSLRAITGSIQPFGGRGFFAGEDVTQLAPHAKAARGLVLVPEGRQLFDSMSVQENLEMGAFSKRARRRFAERLDQIYTLFPRLKERARQNAGTRSRREQHV